MAVIEIVGGVILLVVSVVIFALTLMSTPTVRVWLVSSTAALTAQTTPV